MEFQDESQASNIPQARVGFPRGFHFVPTDQELIQHYLKNKLNNEPISYHICSVNVYNHHPQELAGYYPSLGENEWYFFTPRDRKYQNGNRPNRTADNGHWKATIGDKQIYDNNVQIGFKKTLVFYEGKSPKGKKTNWIMHKYVVDQPSRQQMGTNYMLLDNCLLCRIYNRTHEASEDGKCSTTSISCQIEEQETSKCLEDENLATHKFSKHEHKGTSQQHNISVQCNISVLQPDLPIQQENLLTQEYDLHIENNDRGGWLNYCMESTSGVAGQNDYENIENELGMFAGSISSDMLDLRPDASLIDYLFGDNNLPNQEKNNFNPYLSGSGLHKRN